MRRAFRIGLVLAACASCQKHSPAPLASDEHPVVAGGHARIDAGDDPSDADCHGFGGLIHGGSTCVHLIFSSASIAPLTKRPMPRDASAELDCGKEARLKGARLVLVCDLMSPAPDAATWEKDVTVSVDLYSPANAATAKRVRLDSYRFFWDSIHVWVKETPDGADLAIDYIVYE